MNQFIDRIVVSVRPLSNQYDVVEEFHKAFKVVNSINIFGINISLDLIDQNMFIDNFCYKLKKINEYAQECKLKFNLVHAPFLKNFNFNLSRLILKNFQKSVLKACDYAKLLDTNALVVHPGISQFNSQKTIIDNYKFYLPIVKKLNKMKINLLFENNVVDGYVDGIRTTLLSTSTLVQLCAMYDANGYDNTGICFDAGHANLSRESVVLELYNAKDKLKNLHLHDNYGDNDLNTINIWKNDKHNSFGDGNVNWLEFFKCLQKINYKGDITFEIKYPYNLSSQELQRLIKKDVQFIIDIGDRI